MNTPTVSLLRLPALSIRQPWAWMILNAGKDIENRSWQTDYRGRFLIHAAKGMTQDEYEKLVVRLGSGARVQSAIEILDNAKGAKGYKYKSDYRAILNWVIGELEKREANGKAIGQPRKNDPRERETFTGATVERILALSPGPAAGQGKSKGDK